MRSNTLLESNYARSVCFGMTKKKVSVTQATGMMKMTKTWNEIRPLVDAAIRRGQTKPDFCEEHDITLSQWNTMKPKGFNWRGIRKELGITTKYKPKGEADPYVSADTFKITAASAQAANSAIDDILKEVPKHKACTRCGEANYTERDLCPPCKNDLLECLLSLYRSGFTDADVTEVLGE